MTIDIDALPGSFRRPSPLNSYLQVLNALMLRDMTNRLLPSYWGWIVQVLWPVAHVLIITVAIAIRGGPPPFGESAAVFAATGAVPALTMGYISREVMKGIGQNRPLTYYPHVKVLDVVLARVLVEIVGSFAAVIIISLILLAFGADPVPKDAALAVSGYLAAILLGVGIGMINVSIFSKFQGWALGYIGIWILMYIVSGVAFMPVFMREQIYSILKWNPLVQIIEWVRLGYDPTIPTRIDYMYVLLCGGCTLAIGLVLERTWGRSN